MKRSISEVIALIKEKEKNVTVDILRGDCNDIARAHMLGTLAGYQDVLALLESSHLIK